MEEPPFVEAFLSEVEIIEVETPQQQASPAEMKAWVDHLNAVVGGKKDG